MAGAGKAGHAISYLNLIFSLSSFKSIFLIRFCEAVEMILEALKDYAFEVRTEKFPTKDNFYEMKEDAIT